MKTAEVIATCLVAAVGTYVVMSWMNSSPAPVQFAKTPQAGAAKKVLWAVGDVNLYDSEDPNYCGKCKQWCESSFFEGHSTQCDQCQATCPGVRND